jgi:hypothetical protein
MLLAEQVEKKWKSILEHPDLPEIGDAHRRQVTAMVLENQESDLIESQNGGMFTEAAPTNSVGAMTGNVTKYDPILISLVRRAVPQMIAFDVAGVQPMTGPTGLIFALRARYATTSAASPGLIAKANQADGATSPGEALFNEADTDYSSLAQDAGATTHAGTDAGAAATIPKTGMTTATAEALGDATTNSFAQMGFTIDKVTVTAVSRALKAEYTMELAQDLKAIHGLDAETELANILSTEILSEINREVIRTIYSSAELGAQINTASAGTFNLDTDSNGRWSVEKWKGLLFSIERDANSVGQRTRRGRGNVIITSADVASALNQSGVLDYAPAMSTGINVDDTSTTFAGVLMGRYKVYVDPYMNNATAAQYYVVGYRGTSPFDAGLFYCPYVPLQMVRAVGENSFQPKIGFKTRYGMVANPFATTAGDGVVDIDGTLAANHGNRYYRKAIVTNLM